jgi:uncharacterized membrane protein YccC
VDLVGEFFELRDEIKLIYMYRACCITLTVILFMLLLTAAKCQLYLNLNSYCFVIIFYAFSFHFFCGKFFILFADQLGRFVS